MKRTLLVSITVGLLVIASRALAQPAPAPLPTLPPPASSPSTLNPPAPAAPPAPATPTAVAPIANPNATATPPPSAPSTPSPIAYDVTSAPPVVTQVSAPYAPAEPQAQPPIPCTGPGTFTHDGFYLRFTSGIGGLGVGGSGPNGTAQIRGFASTSTVLIGGTPSRGFSVGGALSSWTLTNSTQAHVAADLRGVQASTLAVFVDWFPNEHRGWHVGGLLGLGVIGISSTGNSDWIGASVGGEAFGGYDFWIGPEWSLGIQGALGFTAPASMMDGNRNDTGYSLGSLGAAVEATLLYH